MTQSTPHEASVSKAARWTGRAASALPVLMLLLSAAMKFLRPPEVVEGVAEIGWPPEYLLGLGILELTCVVVYLVPRTAVLGAILLTGYLGGAVATHVRTGDFFLVPHVVLGVLIWLGLYLRDGRLRRLVPFRQAQRAP